MTLRSLKGFLGSRCAFCHAYAVGHTGSGCKVCPALKLCGAMLGIRDRREEIGTEETTFTLIMIKLNEVCDLIELLQEGIDGLEAPEGQGSL